jgi:hypothetical protein
MGNTFGLNIRIWPLNAHVWVTRQVFLDVIFFVMQQQCWIAIVALVDELEAKFHAWIVMDALGIVYFKY